MMVKVCGLTLETDLVALGDLPIQWGGFIFVRSSPRYCGRKPLVLPKGVQAIGVFRDEPVHAMLRAAEQWNLAGVQLHGAEPPSVASELRANGLLVVKAIGIAGSADLKAATAYHQSVDYLLFDSPGGGTGQTFDWSLLAAYPGPTPFLLAGGIGPTQAPAVKAFHHPHFAGVDLNSRFESAPGAKDLSSLHEFLSHAV